MAGRNFEYFGEDPFLASRTAVAYVEGVQSQGVGSTIKHFIGNNQEYDRHNGDSLIDERTMREIYLPTFEAAVKEGHVCSIMDAYNLTNGEHMTQNGYLNNEVAKKQWGFDGMIMSDWKSTYDGVAAANGGLDLEMPSGAHMNRATLLPAVKIGKVTEATINEHVRQHPAERGAVWLARS
jgi:beta-glucosidase